MSYILEALRKAEQERRLGQVPNVGTLSNLPLPPQQSFWPWFLALALLANATVLAIVLLPSWDRTHIAKIPEITPLPTQPESQPQKKTPSPALKAKPADFIPANPPPIKKPLLEETERLQEPEPSVAKMLKPKAASNAVAVTKELPPLLQAMPVEFSRSVPAMNLDIHVYSTISSKRFVLINSKRYRDGDRLSEGPLLEAITPDGVILHHQGKRFLIPVHR